MTEKVLCQINVCEFSIVGRATRLPCCGTELGLVENHPDFGQTSTLSPRLFKLFLHYFVEYQDIFLRYEFFFGILGCTFDFVFEYFVHFLFDKGHPFAALSNMRNFFNQHASSPTVR